jgi:hypothetical protein
VLRNASAMGAGGLWTRQLVRCLSLDGSADAGQDYAPVDELLVFEPGETSKSVVLVGAA